MKKRIVSLVLATVLTASMVLTGCGGSGSESTQATADTSDTKEETPAADTAAADTSTAESSGGETAPAVSHDEEITIENYNVASNFQGIQSGWFGKVIKDKFNMNINIIAPQVSGDGAALYQTRTADGNLGDMILLDNADMLECVDAGLIADISADIKNYPNLMRYWEQIEAFNENMGEGIYAIPTEMNTNGPTAFLGTEVTSMPRIPWDFYTELGRPELNTLDDLVQVLADMQAAHPTNENGDKAYGITMWKDWDSTSIENVNQLTKWYGQEVNGSVLIGYDNSITPLTDKNGAYYKMLKFFFQANQAGIVDPDSATQDWASANDKMITKRTYMVWNDWMLGFTNTPEKGEAGVNYMGIPIKDMQVFQTSDTYYGSGRCFAIGSQVNDDVKARILEFYDWYASPEGLTTQHAGNLNSIYTVNDDGTYTLTQDGYDRFTKEIMVSEEEGGGTWTDGNNQINQWIGGSRDTNPETGEPYNPNLWSSYLEKNNTRTMKEYKELYDCENEVDYLEKNGMMSPVPSINIILDIDTTDISLIRNQCKTVVCDSSWQAVFAKDEAEFEAIWDDMCTQLDGFGWQDLVAFDTTKYQKVTDARKAAMN